MAKNKESSGKYVFAKIFLVIGIAALFFILTSISKELYKKKQIQDEINRLQEEAERIASENSSIQDKISYLESKDYQEREAKDKLSLQSPDENVVIIKPSITKEEQGDETAVQFTPETPAMVANHIKWWNYFFKY